MAVIQTPLFSWDAVEARSDLDRFFLVRDPLPDEAIVQALETQRGQGRDDFPVRAIWNAVVAGVVFQHPSIESLIRELSRNPSLLEACGFNPLPVQKKPVPQLVRDELSGRMTVMCEKRAQTRFPALPASCFDFFHTHIDGFGELT